MSQKPKKLTSSNILSLHNRVFSQRAIQIDINGTPYQVLIDEKFQPSKIQEMILELAEKQREIRNLDDILNISYYASFLIIKYFTDISVSKTDSLEKQLRVFKALIDLEIYEKLMEAFPDEELEKINKYIKKASDNLKRLEKNPDDMKDIEDIMKELASLQNPEVFLGDVKDKDEDETE